MLFEQRASVVAEPRIERLQFALRRRVNAQLITTSVLRENARGQNQKCKERNDAFHVCRDVEARHPKGNFKRRCPLGSIPKTHPTLF